MFGPFFSIFRPKNCISKNVMAICGDVNSKNKEIIEKVRMRFAITKPNWFN